MKQLALREILPGLSVFFGRERRPEGKRGSGSETSNISKIFSYGNYLKIKSIYYE
jgi:hypothetical protein